eukprot:8659574-Pyramimonas_sp.AAC.1
MSKSVGSVRIFAMRSAAIRMSRFGPGSVKALAFTCLDSNASATHFVAKTWFCCKLEAAARMADFFHIRKEPASGSGST